MATPGTSTPGQRALAEAARMETARVYGSICREHVQAEPAAATASGVFRRPADTYYGPAPASDLVELVEAIVPPRSAGRPRIPVEQAIARGLDDEQISAVMDLDATYVASVRAGLDRAAS